MPKEQVTQLNEYVWSETINGLSGLLYTKLEDLRPGLRYAVYLELRNCNLNPVTVSNQPIIDAKLFDSAGKFINTTGFPVSGPDPNPQYAVIPRNSYAGFRIDRQIVGVPYAEKEIALLAIGDKSWKLGAGGYLLKVVVRFGEEENSPPGKWIGELNLPTVEIGFNSENVIAE